MDFPAFPRPPWLERVLATAHNLLPARFRSDIPVVPVVRLSGTIGFSTPLRPGLTLTALARTLDRAFAYRRAKAIAIVINSPGGSAVQSHLIHTRIRQLSAAKGVPVIAFVEDVAASGGYMIACAADEIIGDASSIVGSIGVVGGSFGFHRLIEKIGVERRLYTSGEHKAMLDPFLPEEPGDVQRLKAIQREIHDDFIALVKGRRPSLIGADSELFSGEYWTGRRALELGLIDGLGDIRSVLRGRFGEEVRMPLIATERGWFGRRVQGVGTSGLEALLTRSAVADDLISALETRALWARFGL
jgi:serine protease SohB